MKILLVGEYSRLHNSLKEGLLELGHEVTILGFNDGFKNYPVDFKLVRKWDSGLLKKIRVGLYKISGFDISSLLTYRQFWKIRKSFIGFDVVQFINENSFQCTYFYEKKILQYLFSNNEKSFLLSCGPDYLVTKYEFENPDKKSVVTPYLAGKIADKDFINILKFRTRSFKKLHEYIYQNIDGIIASDIDYHIPLQGDRKYLGLIPNPVNFKKFEYVPNSISGRIHIFHGINNGNYYHKGNDYFEKALEIIGIRHADKVTILTTRSLPYDEYIKAYDRCHIVLDQVYAYDQGYNALEAMAKGKVVFTGAETEFMEHYNLTDRVAINALPDVDSLVAELSTLINNPIEISRIARNARTFIEKEHDYILIGKKYLDTWNVG